MGDSEDVSSKGGTLKRILFGIKTSFKNENEMDTFN